jgi:2-polyprenyl-6-methoxyphenol hydroxylase-like FAD-dependent oxidoreductase
MDVIVVGGGIAGLSAALSLHAAGQSVKVFESAPRIEALGLGIHLQPNAVRELTELGLGDVLRENAVSIDELAFCNRHGQFIWREPRGTNAGYGWPQYAINRGTLQVLLLDAVRSRIGEAGVLTGHKLASFSQDAEGVSADFIDTLTGKSLGTHRGDVLIGADGLHSVVRQSFYPDQELRFGGQLMWRGAVVAKPFLSGKSFIIAGHKNQKVVAYPMLTLPDGNIMLNVITELHQIESTPREEWNRKVDKSKFDYAFRDWRFDWLDLPALIDSLEVVYEFPKIDRDPVDRWTFDRVTLIGDAAHPMHPVGSQAGSQAVVDGRSVAYHLARHCNDPQLGLLAYEAERLPAMKELALQNRTLGPEVVMDIAEERAPGGFTDVGEVLTREELQERADSFKKLAGFSVAELNARHSYSVAPDAMEPMPS